MDLVCVPLTLYVCSIQRLVEGYILPVLSLQLFQTAVLWRFVPAVGILLVKH